MREVGGLLRSVVVGIELDAIEPQRFVAAVYDFNPDGLQPMAREADAEQALALAVARDCNGRLKLVLAPGLRALEERSLLSMRRVVDGQPSPHRENFRLPVALRWRFSHANDLPDAYRSRKATIAITQMRAPRS